MKKLIPVLIAIPFSIFCQPDEKFIDNYRLVTASRLSLRAKPDKDSRRLALVEYDERVKLLSPPDPAISYHDTIDNIPGNWLKVEYEGLSGYMFDGYLAVNPIRFYNSRWKGNYLLLQEGHSSHVYFSEELDWYGIFAGYDGEFLEKVNIELNHSCEAEPGKNIKVSTGLKEKARLLIGARNGLKEGCVGIPLGRFTNNLVLSSQTLPLPMYRKDGSVGNHYFLFANGRKDQINSCFIENYSLEFCSQLNNFQVQTIYTFEGITEEDSDCNLPYLYWFGDLNGDYVPDFVFYHMDDNKVKTKYKLYISEKNEENISFEKVAELELEF